MFRSWRLGAPFGIDVFIHWTFAALPVLVMILNWGDVPATLWHLAVVLGVFACVVLHELGHALAARYFGIPTRDITLTPIGGIARLERMSDRPWEELCIALAGPVVNAGLAILFLVLGGLGFWIWSTAGGALVWSIQGEELWLTSAAAATPAATVALAAGLTVLKLIGMMVFANLMLGLFNLLPAFPMDGGRVFRAVLAMFMPRLRATVIAANVGAVLALGLALLAFWNPMLLLLAGFVFIMGRQELMMLQLQEMKKQAPPEGIAEPAQGVTLEVNAVAPTTIPERFSGVLWDKQAGVWVIWQDGRPVGTVGGNPPERPASSTDE